MPFLKSLPRPRSPVQTHCAARGPVQPIYAPLL